MLKIGVLTSPHGIKGEMKVYPTTDSAERFRDLEKVTVMRHGAGTEMKVEGVRFFKNMVILKLSGIPDRNTAEEYRRCDLMIPREDAVKLEENQYFVGDLIGMKVFTENGEEFGLLYDIIETGANDVYVIKTAKYGDVMLPAIKDCILDVDPEQGRMKVHLLPGLVDL
ncbi:MAG: ribosome maturation factor RimM [Eubacterium sp.]|nr:ribosome maturation factor RimM [Eubacterium sp.]